MLNHGFARAEWPRDTGCAAFCNRKERVDNTLACDKNSVGCKPSFDRPGASDRALLHKLQLGFAAVVGSDNTDSVHNAVVSLRNFF